jgi:hypothetical protein
MQSFPHPCLVPFSEASPTGHARAASHLLGQHLPGYAALEDEQDAGESGAIVDVGSPSFGLGRLFWEQRLDHFPQFVCNEFFSHTLSLPTAWFC